MRAVTPERYITLEEVAQFLSCSTRTIRRLMDRGQIPFYRLGGSPRFILEEVHQAIQRTVGRGRRRRRVAKIPVREYIPHPEVLETQIIGGVANG
ncbi:MAG: helix-turn-helix domain-containing protein [Candidatus Brocadiales bacterium]|nr:helix-turn-helix domain-containing protein [Candidatus Brocadiales bacterium]